MMFKTHRLLYLCRQSPGSNGRSGFTLIESLVAIVILSIMLVGIAPIIVLSTATRVQARRVELATQAARAYIDGVRSGAIAPPNSVIELDETTGTNNDVFDSKRDLFAGKAAPGADSLTACTTTTTGYPYCPNPASDSTTNVSLYCVDRDGGGCSNGSASDLIVQAYRSVTDASGDDDEERAMGYLLGVRVYRANAFQGTGTLKKNTVQKSYGATLDRQAPLIEMTAEITGDNTSFDDFCGRVGGCTKDSP